MFQIIIRIAFCALNNFTKFTKQVKNIKIPGLLIYDSTENWIMAT